MLDFQSKFANIAKLRVLVIGDIMLDIFQYGKVERISPEAPVPIFNFKNENSMLGGAGNVVSNIEALGASCDFLGIIGNDIYGKKISKLLKQSGAHSHLLKVNDYPSIVKTRLISGNNHILRVDREEKIPVIEEYLPKIRRILSIAVKNVDIVIISDYNKGAITSATGQMIISLCRQYNKTVLVDPKGFDYSRYYGATLVKPNLKEFSEVSSMSYDPASSDFYEKIKIGAKSVFSRFNIDNLVITLSENGMLYVNSKDLNSIYHVKNEPREVFDVSGAGDTSLATLSVCLGLGFSFENATIIANRAAGIVVSKLGTATLSLSELQSVLVK